MTARAGVGSGLLALLATGLMLGGCGGSRDSAPASNPSWTVDYAQSTSVFVPQATGRLLRAADVLRAFASAGRPLATAKGTEQGVTRLVAAKRTEGPRLLVLVFSTEQRADLAGKAYLRRGIVFRGIARNVLVLNYRDASSQVVLARAACLLDPQSPHDSCGG